MNEKDRQIIEVIQTAGREYRETLTSSYRVLENDTQFTSRHNISHVLINSTDYVEDLKELAQDFVVKRHVTQRTEPVVLTNTHYLTNFIRKFMRVDEYDADDEESSPVLKALRHCAEVERSGTNLSDVTNVSDVTSWANYTSCCDHKMTRDTVFLYQQRLFLEKANKFSEFAVHEVCRCDVREIYVTLVC